MKNSINSWLDNFLQNINSFFDSFQYVNLDSNSVSFFGFSEFISGLALIMLVWTLSNPRYKFRVKAMAFPLQKISFFIILIIGFLTLATDLYRSESFSVISISFINLGIWQAILGGSFFAMLMFWLWATVQNPVVFSRFNYKNYANALFEVIQKGSSSELGIVADEVSKSAKSLIKYALEFDKRIFDSEPIRKDHSKVSAYASDILFLIGDKKFCKAVVEYSSVTAYLIFKEISLQKKYKVQISIFAKNIFNEAMINKNSFLFHETSGYQSGLIGHLKPLTNAMYSDYYMVEEIGSLLDPDLESMWKWDSEQWEAYCRTVKSVLNAYIQAEEVGHSYTLYRALGNIKNSVSNLSKLDGMPVSEWDQDIHDRLRVVIDFINDSLELLKDNKLSNLKKPQKNNLNDRNNIYYYLAQLIFEIIHYSGYVRSPWWTSWVIQHNVIWSTLFRIKNQDNKSVRLVQFNLRRLIYDEIKILNTFPNYKGARILGFFTNVLGLIELKKEDDKNSWIIQKIILKWMKDNYKKLIKANKQVAEYSLCGNISYESNKSRLVKTYPADGLRIKPKFVYYKL